MEPIIKIPDNIKVKETQRSYYWLDKNGIMCSVSKKNAPTATVDEIRDILSAFVEEAQGQKFCFLADVTYSKPNDKETREYVAVEFPKIVTALAMVSASPMGRMVASLFFALKPTPYPAKIFATEAEARKWLEQYL